MIYVFLAERMFESNILLMDGAIPEIINCFR